jgi:chemotaxis protein MotB
MRGTIIAALRVTLLCAILFSLGCEDPQKKIAQLQEEKKALGQQLTEASQARDTAVAEANELKQRNAQLQSDLTAARQAPPPAAPAPVAAAPRVEALKLIGTLSNADFGRASKPDLTHKDKAELDRIASTIKANHAKDEIYVIGHTDNDPIRKTKWRDNLELSCERAMMVVRYLASRGIPHAHLIAGGAGEYDPLAPNTGPASKAKNRRIEIYAGPKPSH